MIHPDTEIRFISPEKGYGVVAKKFIPKGTITWAMDKLDRVFPAGQIDSLPNLYKEILSTYAYRDNMGNYVLCWDNARFVNHSFNSNCLTTAYNFEIAIRDIEPGEELTDDYGYLNVIEPFIGVPEKGSKRTAVYPDDLVHYHKEWDRKLLSSFKFLHQVEQPLLVLLEQEVKEKAFKIAMGEEKMDSILNCLFKEPYLNGVHRPNGKEHNKVSIRK